MATKSITSKDIVTKEQIAVEKEYKNITEMYASMNISEIEANNKIEELLSKALADGIFLGRDMHSYQYRRDPKNTRSHIQFAMFMRQTHIEEKDTFLYFVDYLKNKGKKVEYDNFGSDDNGYVMIANFKERRDAPAKPDYKIKWGEKWKNMEVKNFRNEIWLKVDNLKIYNKYKSYLLIKYNGLYYIFSAGSSSYLLDNLPYPPEDRHGKPSVIVTVDGVNSHFSLKELINASNPIVKLLQ